MGKTEFIDQLRKSLSGSLGSSTVNENIRYYQEYIELQIREGESEQEVISRLGDPRLLAKSIIEASRSEGSRQGSASEYTEVYEAGRQTGGKSFRIPGWMLLMLFVLIILLVLGLVTSLVTAALPILIPALAVVWVVRMVRRKL